MDIKNTAIDIADIPDIEPNEFHPMNDQFNRDVAHTQKVIMAHQRQMKRKHVNVVKMRFAGHSNEKIAELTGYSASNVSVIMGKKKSQRLLALLNYLDAAMVGPSVSHRLAILNRIIVRNEVDNPKVALQALAEMNKMDMNEHNKGLTDLPTTTNITINQNYFPKTPLDG